VNAVQIWYFRPVIRSQAKPARNREERRAQIRSAATIRASIDERHLVGARLSKSTEGDVRLRLEPLDAPTLAVVLRRGPLRPKTAVTMLAGVARAVDALERSGLVARDLSPDHVLLDRARGAVLGDYGIPPQLVPLTRPEPDPYFAFRAPEERAGGGLSPRASVYSLGTLLLAALTGEARPERLSARQESQARDLPPTLGSVIARAMASDPERRYTNAIEMARAAVEAVQAGERLDRARAARGTKPAKPVRVVAWSRPRAVPNAEAAKPARGASASTRAVITRPTRRVKPERDAEATKAAATVERKAADAAEHERKAAEAAEREATKAAAAAEREAANAAAAAEREAARVAERERKAAEAAEREAAKVAERERKAVEAAEREAAKAAAAAEREAANVAERERKAAEGARRDAAKAAEHEATAAAERERRAVEAAKREGAKVEERERRRALVAEREAAKAADRERKAKEAAERDAAKKAAAAEREAAKAADRERKANEAAERKAAKKAVAAERQAARKAAAAGRKAAKAAEHERKAKDAAARTQTPGKARTTRGRTTRRKRGENGNRTVVPARSTNQGRTAVRRGAPHRKPAAAQPRKRQNAPVASQDGTSRVGRHRDAIILTVAGVLAAAAGAGAITFATGGGEEAGPGHGTRINNGDLSMRLPAGWKQTHTTEGRFGSLSSSLTAGQADGKHAVLLTGTMVEPSETTAAIRRLAPNGTRPVPTHLGELEVTRYGGLETRPGTTGAAYVLNTTGPSVLIVCEASGSPATGALRDCAKVAASLRLDNELPLSVAAAKARRPAAYRALANLGTARVAARERIAQARLAADQSDAASDLQISYYEASRRVEATGLPGASVAKLVAALTVTGDSYGVLADAIADGDQATYDHARAQVLAREAELWPLMPPRVAESISDQP
jgi:hypothetical protein